MADLKGIIRLREHELDEKRRALGELNARLSQLEQHKQAILDQMESEKEAVEQNPELLHPTLGDYLNAARQGKEAVEEMMRNLDKEIAEATDEVREAFAEFKKFEMTQLRREDEERKELEAKETAELDEIGIDAHRRREDE